MHDPQLVERLCVAQHDAYEAAATREGWETQAASRKPWSDVPEANRATMRASVGAVLDLLAAEGRLTAPPEPEPAGARPWDVKDGCW